MWMLCNIWMQEDVRFRIVSSYCVCLEDRSCFVGECVQD